MAKKYVDNAEVPIIAFDFDGTITKDTYNYPECGELRRNAKEVINFLHDIGCKIIIWTCRDVEYSERNRQPIRDHIAPMVEFLYNNKIEYDRINESRFAPYYYYGRKIYAHLYVDDRTFGWTDTEDIMVKVLQHILIDILDMDGNFVIEEVVRPIFSDERPSSNAISKCTRAVKEWKK